MDSPGSRLQDWISGWTQWLSTTLPVIILLVVLVLGTVILVRRTRVIRAVVDGEWRVVRVVRGGVAAALAFGILAALAYLILTNLEAVADLFRRELPTQD